MRPPLVLERSRESLSKPGPLLDRADVIPLTLLVGGLIALFWRIIFTPAMLFYRDVFSYSYPHARFIHEACRQGTLPYWNPYVNYGEPVLANPNFLFFYPDTLLLVLLPIDLGYALHYVAHFALAAIGTYCLARRWGQSRVGAFFAGFVFAFSGPVLSLGNFYNHAAGAAWIPWALLFTDYAVESASVRPWIGLTLAFSFQFLASEPFTLFATFALSLALALHRAGALRHPLIPPARRLLARFAIAGCLVVALSAVQLFPALDLLRHSRRGQGLTFNQTAGWSFHPLSLLDVVLPDFFGPSFATPGLWSWILNWGGEPYFPSVFLGFVPLFFAFLGWARGRDRRRNLAAAAGLTLLLLSFGRLTPLFALAYLVLPPLELVRFPAKLLVPAVLMVALLSGWGVDASRELEDSPPHRRARTLLPLGALLASAALVWIVSWVAPQLITGLAAWLLERISAMVTRSPAPDLTRTQVADSAKFFLTMLQLYLPGLAGFALGSITWTIALERGRSWARRALPAVVLLGCAQMVIVNSHANPTVPKTFYTFRPPVLSYFEDSTLPYRFCNVSRDPVPRLGSVPEDFVNFDSIPEAAAFSGLALGSFRDRLSLARGSMLERVEAGITGDVEGSLSSFVYDFWGYQLSELEHAERLDCLLGRSNVRYLLAPKRQPAATRREISRIFDGSSKPSFLYEDLCFMPRAYVAGRASWSRDARQTVTRMASPDFDAQNEIILSGDRVGVEPDEGPGSAGEVAIVERLPNAVTLRAELWRPGYVVLLDRFDPNWHAAVDGREVSVLRANQMFRAVRAGAGRHEIRFYYRQRGLRAGAVISFVALVLLAAIYAKAARA